ncbi:hypothetical protein D7X74_40955 [Corallococcus sp. CA047B]|nr:hypothetical protein D7X74_40955 [Corallococcus sp. CA047B]
MAEETATALVDLANVLEREALAVDAPPRVPAFPDTRAHRWARLLLSCHTMSAALRQPLDSARSVTRFNNLIALANADPDFRGDLYGHGLWVRMFSWPLGLPGFLHLPLRKLTHSPA